MQGMDNARNGQRKERQRKEKQHKERQHKEKIRLRLHKPRKNNTRKLNEDMWSLPDGSRELHKLIVIDNNL